MKIMTTKKLLFIAFLTLIFCAFAFGQNSNCPTISVTGPSSVNRTGETMTFTVNVRENGNDLSKLSYQWSVSDGTIIEDQFAPVIYVDPSNARDNEITATVKIKNLPAGCADSFSAKVELCKFCGTPIKLSDYGKISWKDEQRRLRTIAGELRQNENSAALFIIHYTKKDNRQTLKKRVSKIENFLVVENKIPKEKIGFIFVGVGASEQTRVYLAPIELEYGKSNWEKNLNELKFSPNNR